jgi:ParB family chromosome partitioning protein
VIEAASPEESRGQRHLPIELLHSNPNNPRKQFKEEELEDLSKSIREKGLLQPIVVRQRADGEFEIVAGERRWRASQRAAFANCQFLSVISATVKRLK